MNSGTLAEILEDLSTEDRFNVLYDIDPDWPERHVTWGSAWEFYRDDKGIVREALQRLGYDVQPDHFSDCAVHNAPALPIGQCNCRQPRD